MGRKGRRTAARRRAAPAQEQRREAVSRPAMPSAEASKAAARLEARTRGAAGAPEAAGMAAVRPGPAAAAAAEAWACLLVCLVLPDAADRRFAWPLLPLAGTILRNQTGRLNTLDPFGPPTIHSSAIPMKRPCSTTPVTAFNEDPSADASAMPSSKLKSRMRLPLSVT